MDEREEWRTRSYDTGRILARGSAVTDAASLVAIAAVVNIVARVDLAAVSGQAVAVAHAPVAIVAIGATIAAVANARAVRDVAGTMPTARLTGDAVGAVRVAPVVRRTPRMGVGRRRGRGAIGWESGREPVAVGAIEAEGTDARAVAHVGTRTVTIARGFGGTGDTVRIVVVAMGTPEGE